MDDHYQQDYSEPWQIQPDDPRVNDLSDGDEEDTEETDVI